MSRGSSSLVPSAGGVLLVDKPEGPTSHDVVQRIRRTLRDRRVGHTGTLDPFASGLLVLCMGAATRLSEYLSGMDKEYVAVVRLGRTTTTLDREGDVVTESERWRGLARSDLEDALGPLRGTILQTPPAFSAKKLAGEPAHRRVRRGETFELPAASVTVRELELLDVQLPDVRLRVSCSSGTYVRALARDWGEALGAGAHLTELRRVRVGPFDVRDAASADTLDAPDALLPRIIDPASALSHLPSVSLGAAEAARLAQGQEVPAPATPVPEGEAIAVLRSGTLVAVATAVGGRLKPRKVFAGWET